MADYIATGDEEVVLKQDSEQIDLVPLVNEYLNLKNELQNLPALKNTPDQETLDFWNTFYLPFIETETASLNTKIINLYNKLKPIYDAGLFPSKWNSQYTQLENYVNNI